MQEQKIIILPIHTQNSLPISICCSALKYNHYEALNSDLQISNSDDKLDNYISSAMPVYDLVPCVSLMNCFGYVTISLTIFTSGLGITPFTSSRQR